MRHHDGLEARTVRRKRPRRGSLGDSQGTTGAGGDLFPGRSNSADRAGDQPRDLTPARREYRRRISGIACDGRHRAIGYCRETNDERGLQATGFPETRGLGRRGLCLGACMPAPARRRRPADDFFFVQLSDCHWGFDGPPNPDARGTLKKAVAAVNSLEQQPEFIVFTGDLTHTTDDPKERRQRMTRISRHRVGAEGRRRPLHAGRARCVARQRRGVHRAFRKDALHLRSQGRAFHRRRQRVRSRRPHRRRAAASGWRRTSQKLPKDARIVVLTHRPLFDLYPQWDWATRDGADAVKLLLPHDNVTVFYGHIHQEHHHMTGHIAHHAAKSLIFPLPAPGSQPARTPLAVEPGRPVSGTRLSRNRRGRPARELCGHRIRADRREDFMIRGITAIPACAIAAAVAAGRVRRVRRRAAVRTGDPGQHQAIRVHAQPRDAEEGRAGGVRTRRRGRRDGLQRHSISACAPTSFRAR